MLAYDTRTTARSMPWRRRLLLDPLGSVPTTRGRVPAPGPGGVPATRPGGAPAAPLGGSPIAASPVVVLGPALGAMLAPTPDTRILRRLRRVVRRRVRVELDGLVSAVVRDGDLELRVDTLAPRDPHALAWVADRPVAIVVLHDGCGARVIGGGGRTGRIELPSVRCAGAFLSFCYDGETGSGPAL